MNFFSQVRQIRGLNSTGIWSKSANQKTKNCAKNAVDSTQ